MSRLEDLRREHTEIILAKRKVTDRVVGLQLSLANKDRRDERGRRMSDIAYHIWRNDQLGVLKKLLGEQSQLKDRLTIVVQEMQSLERATPPARSSSDEPTVRALISQVRNRDLRAAARIRACERLLDLLFTEAP